MPSDTVVNATAGSWDVKATALTPYLVQADTNKTFPHATCESITYTVGPDPGVAMCKIPLRDLDDTAPAVAAVAKSPAAGLKLLGSGFVTNTVTSRTNGVQAVASETKVFRGLITKISHEFGPGADHANVRLEDARWLLKRTPIIGRWDRSDTVGSTTATYRQGWPAWPNQFSQPNAIYSTSDSVFVFCKPRMGLSGDESPPDPSKHSTTQATWWTDATFFGYLKFATYFTPSVVGRDKPPYTQVSQSFEWPIGLASMMESETSPAKPTNYDGKNLADTLSELARHAGPYDITMEFGGEKPSLALVRTKYVYGDSAITINRADNTSNNIADAKVVMAGELSEDADQFYSRVTVAGALVFVERRVSSVATSGLIPAWSEATSGSGVAFVNDRLSSGDTAADAMKKAFSKFPDWYGAWRLNSDVNFMTGISSLAGFSVAKVGRPVADRLLTSYVADGENADPSDRSQWRRPILFEWRHTGADTFKLASEGDGLQIDINGTIRLYGLRNVAADIPGSTQAYYLETKTPESDGIETIEGNQLRVTLGIPCDHRVSKSMRHRSAWVDGDSDQPEFPSDCYDEDRVEPGVTGGHAYMVGGDQDALGDGTFRQELRASGWPVPESVTASNEFSDGVIWEDTGALFKATARQASKLMRLRRGGTLIIPRLSAAYRVGQVLGALGYEGGAYPIRAVVTKITWANQDGNQRTVLDLGG